ncbi:MAG: SprB repeat-containing protein, partial [Bacteroidales bacterium]|nr:SprB repeat-containing protein [Bacteroidales bacterium]
LKCDGVDRLLVSFWAANINNERYYEGSYPNITMGFYSDEACTHLLAERTTGPIPPMTTYGCISDANEWQYYQLELPTIEYGTRQIWFRIANNTGTNDGNDFVIDDIEVRACLPPSILTRIGGEHEIFSSANVCAGEQLRLLASLDETLGAQSRYPTPYYAWERGEEVTDPNDPNYPIRWTRMNFGDYGREGEWATCDTCERLAFTNCEDISYGANDGFENYNDITIVEVQSPTAPAYTHYYYRVIVAGSVDDLNGNICISTSNTFEINVTRIAEIEFGGTNAICEGGVINLAVTETSPAGTWSIYAENGNTDGPFSATITNSGTDYSIANVVHDEITVQYTTSNANGGCWNQKTIPIYPLPEVTITPENTTICEGTDVTLHPSSNQQSSFQWSGGPSCSNTDWASDNTCADWTVNPITTTTYTLTVTTPHNILDEEGQDYVLQCAFSESKTVTVSPSVELNVTPSHIACNGESNGTVTVAVTSGISPYTYEWSDNADRNSNTATGIAAGNYEVTVTDANSCSASAVTIVTEPDVLTVALSAGEILCNGGTSPYAYAWQGNSSTESSLSGVGAGTYSVTVTDSHGCTATASTTISVNDQIPPELTGTWPSNITGQNNCFANADISGLLSNDAVEALYEDCSGITVSHTDANTSTDNCGWTITRTYTIQDPYGNTVEPNPTMSVSGSDQSAPELTGTWPANITGQNNCFADADIRGLISDDDVADLYSDGCGGTVTVSHSDASTLTDNCGWTITRTYTIRDACGNETTNTMSVSGSDQSEPALAGTWPDNITGQDNCFANADLSGLISDDEAAAQYIDGCGGSVTVSHSDANTLTDNCGWTITRTYTITNACGTNSTTITQSVSGSDQSAPTLSGTWPANITAQNNCFADADVSGLMSDDDVSELYSDGCGGTISVTHTDANTTTDNCGWTITRTYTISDVCGNEVTKTQSVSGSDETAPTIGDDNLDRQLTSTNCVFT